MVSGERSRHSGNVRVRGLIVRKWRPRYLELCADGTLRYFECGGAPAATSASEHAQSMDAAATDAPADLNDITGDEILDGWQTLTRADVSSDQRRAADDKSARNGSSYGHRPKATMLVLHARAIDPTSMKDLHIGLPAGRFGFMFRGRALLSPTTKGTPALLDADAGVVGVQESSRDVARDYFCCVNTAEEGDAWIVALRWAATMTKLSDRAALTCSIGSLTSSSASGAPPSTPDNDSSDTIIITSVRSQKTVWRRMAMPESYFEIRTLLLQRSSENAAIAARGEERIAHRSCTELLCLIADLSGDCRIGASKHSRQVLERVQNQALVLNQMCVWKQPLWIFGLSSPNLASHKYDEILRSLSRDEVWCNAYQFKSFLGCLDDIGPGIGRRRIDCSSKSTDALVKLWLHREESPAGARTRFGRERLATIVVGTSSMCLFRPVSRWYHSIVIPSITIRADVFSGVVITAALAGMYFGAGTGSLSALPSPLSLPPRASKDDIKAIDNATLVDEDEISLSFSLSGEEVEEVASAETSLYKDEKSRRNLTNPLQLNNSSQSTNCWSEPPHLFKVRGATYLQDRVKIESSFPAFACRGVDLWLNSDDMACRHIARHPAVLGGNLGAENTFLVNFLLPFGNLVAYFKIPEETKMKPPVRKVWRRFIDGDQAFRDSQLKLLPVLQEGPWIVQKAVGPGHSPALLGKVVPCQYYFCTDCSTSKSMYEVDVHISYSRVASAILNVVRGHTKGLRIAFAFILEGKEEDELPETVLCAFALNKLEIELCQPLPPFPSEDESSII